MQLWEPRPTLLEPLATSPHEPKSALEMLASERAIRSKCLTPLDTFESRLRHPRAVLASLVTPETRLVVVSSPPTSLERPPALLLSILRLRPFSLAVRPLFKPTPNLLVILLLAAPLGEPIRPDTGAPVKLGWLSGPPDPKIGNILL